MQTMEEWIDSLTFRDDIMFQQVMKNERICRKVLELILGFSIRRVIYPKTEEKVENAIGLHGIRLDVYVEDEDGRMFDVEMQNSHEGDLARRSRYYQGMMDSSSLERGAKDYRKLPDSYLIFITRYNPFGGDHVLYKMKTLCVDDPNVPFEDGAWKIYLCLYGKRDNTPIEICRFIDYLKGNEPSDDLTKRIENEVIHWKNDGKWRKNMWENHAREWDIRAEAEASFNAEQKRLADLVKVLRGAGEIDLALDAVSNTDLRNSLYKKYGIE